MLGSHLSFDLTVSSNFFGTGSPDRLTLSLLDAATSFSLVDSDLDLVGGAVDVDDALVVVDYFAGASRMQAAAVSSVPVVIPESATGVLLALGFALLGGQRIRQGGDSVFKETSPVAGADRATSKQFKPGE